MINHKFSSATEKLIRLIMLESVVAVQIDVESLEHKIRTSNDFNYKDIEIAFIVNLAKNYNKLKNKLFKDAFNYPLSVFDDYPLEKLQIFNDGFKAGLAKKDSCPHPHCSIESALWDVGYEVSEHYSEIDNYDDLNTFAIGFYAALTDVSIDYNPHSPSIAAEMWAEGYRYCSESIG